MGNTIRFSRKCFNKGVNDNDDIATRCDRPCRRYCQKSDGLALSGKIRTDRDSDEFAEQR